MLTRQQQLLIMCGVLGGVVILGLIATSGKKAEAPGTVAVETITPATTPNTPVTEPAPAPANTPAKKPAAPAPTYDQLVESYKASGYRFQFSNCTANPTSLTIKQGMKYMIDNRDATKHTIVVGKRSYTISGYGYVIASASDLGQLNITCDGRGAGTLNVQP